MPEADRSGGGGRKGNPFSFCAFCAGGSPCGPAQHCSARPHHRNRPTAPLQSLPWPREHRAQLRQAEITFFFTSLTQTLTRNAQKPRPRFLEWLFCLFFVLFSVPAPSRKHGNLNTAQNGSSEAPYSCCAFWFQKAWQDLTAARIGVQGISGKILVAKLLEATTFLPPKHS